jgi:hypothetical protein
VGGSATDQPINADVRRSRQLHHGDGACVGNNLAENSIPVAASTLVSSDLD